MRDSSTRQRIANTTRNETVPMISSTRFGDSGPRDESARYMTVSLSALLASHDLWRSGVVEDERHHEADQRECLGQREPDVHVGADHPGRLRLPGHGLHAVAEDQADAHAGADGRQTVRHRTDVDADDALRGGSGGQEVN